MSGYLLLKLRTLGHRYRLPRGVRKKRGSLHVRLVFTKIIIAGGDLGKKGRRQLLVCDISCTTRSVEAVAASSCILPLCMRLAAQTGLRRMPEGFNPRRMNYG
jgi:hypothetical protein